MNCLFFFIYYIDVPFQSGYYTHGDDAFHRLYSSQIQYDASIWLLVDSSLDSIELFNHILPYVIQLPEDINDDNPLVIKTDADYNKLNDKTWSSIIIHDNILCDIKDELILNDYLHIQFIHIHSSSFQHIQSLIITNLPDLQCIMIDDNSFKETGECNLSSIH